MWYNKKLDQVSPEHLQHVRSLQAEAPEGWRSLRYRKKKERQARDKLKHLKDPPPTWQARHLYLENIIERDERRERTRRMLFGLPQSDKLWHANAGAVRSAGFSYAIRSVASSLAVKSATYMKLSPAGAEPGP